MNVIEILIIWVAVSFFGVILTAYDKKAASLHRRRIRESTLMLFGLIGGALPMYIVMRKIRHKTLHKKFMIGFPLFMILQIAAIIFFYKY
jgi:uncharacterized membrane protein YsdA (DUF1294 family)